MYLEKGGDPEIHKVLQNGTFHCISSVFLFFLFLFKEPRLN